MFVAGLADGMGKPKLILSPAAHDAPLDVRDDVKNFKRASDIFELIANFSHSLMSTQVEPSLLALTAHLSFNLSALAILVPRTR